MARRASATRWACRSRRRPRRRGATHPRWVPRLARPRALPGGCRRRQGSARRAATAPDQTVEGPRPTRRADARRRGRHHVAALRARSCRRRCRGADRGVLAVASRAPPATNAAGRYTSHERSARHCRAVVPLRRPGERETHDEEYAYYPTTGGRPSSSAGARAGGNSRPLGIAKTTRPDARAASPQIRVLRGPGRLCSHRRTMRQGDGSTSECSAGVMVAARGLARHLPQAAFTSSKKSWKRSARPRTAARGRQSSAMRTGRDENASDRARAVEQSPPSSTGEAREAPVSL